jgi:hypothetical protein
MWSRAWLLPALPGRKVIANNSVVLSHHTPIGVKPEPALEPRPSLLLLRVRGHQGGIDIQHHHLAQLGASNLDPG